MARHYAAILGVTGIALLSIGVANPGLPGSAAALAPAEGRVAVQIVDPERVRVLRPDVERYAVQLPEHRPEVGWRFHRAVSLVERLEFPEFEIHRRDPGEPPLPSGMGYSGGRSYGPGVLSVQARANTEDSGAFELRKAEVHFPRPPAWKWSAPEKYHFRWDHYSKMDAAGSQDRERYLAMVAHDPRWEAPPSLLLFDALAHRDGRASTAPLWEADFPLGPFHAAAPAHNIPRLKRERTVPEADRHRAAVSVTPDGSRILVWLEPEPDSEKVGLWLFNGEGRLLKTLVIPGRYASGMHEGPIKRSPLGSHWAVTVAREAPPDTEEAPSRGYLRRSNVLKECYLISREGVVIGRTANKRGQDIDLRAGSYAFTQDDQWAFGAYSLDKPGTLKPRRVGCYYRLGALR